MFQFGVGLTDADKSWLLRQFAKLRGNIIMATQAEVDAITAALTDLKTELTADDAAIQQAIADLQTAHPDVDLTALNAAVSALSDQVDATGALVPPAAPVPTDN